MKSLTRKTSLRVAAFFSLFTFLGHTAGLFMKIPPEQIERARLFESMQQKLVPLAGANRSYVDLWFGANACLSVYLFIAGLIFVLLSRTPPAGQDNAILVLNCVGLLITAVLSALYFFPVPAMCLALAAVFGAIAVKRATVAATSTKI